MATNKKHSSMLEKFEKIELVMLKKPEHAKEFLSTEGFIVEETVNYADKFMTRLKFKVEALKNQQNDQKLLEKAYTKLKQAINSNAEIATSTLQELLRRKNPAFQFRKLEQWTDEELKEVLADMDLVEFLEKFSNENQS
jgi:oligoribonuclease (3'-5' exoribonuclease)